MAGRADDRRIATALTTLSQATNIAERRARDDPPWLMAYRGGDGAVTVGCGGRTPRAARRIAAAVTGLCDAVGLPDLFSVLYVERLSERILRVWDDDNTEILALVDHAGTVFLADWVEELGQLSGEIERLFGPVR
ncbi:MAG: hypothetical protein ACLGJC_06535 [Alphaproteobacteria bacterium]